MDKPNTPPAWDETWLNMAKEMARRSKDPHTQVGCFIVSPDNRRHFSGYNGFPAGFCEATERWQRPIKYDRCLHAEENALAHRNCDVKGWKCYTTCFPCHRCALQLVSCGIDEVIYIEESSKGGMGRHELARDILLEGGITLTQIRRNGNEDNG